MASNLADIYKSSPVIFTLISSDIVSVPGESFSAEGLSGSPEEIPESPFEQATKCQDKNTNARIKRFVMASIFILIQI